MADERTHGKVAHVGNDNEYYFLMPDNQTSIHDLYAGRKNLTDQTRKLTKGERVTFLIVNGTRGLKADQVSREADLTPMEMPIADRSEKLAK